MATAIPRSVSRHSAEAAGASVIVPLVIGPLLIGEGRTGVTVDVRSTEGWACATETVIALNVVSPSGKASNWCSIERTFDFYRIFDLTPRTFVQTFEACRERVNHSALTGFAVDTRRRLDIYNTLEQMFESVCEVLYRQRYGTKRLHVSEAEQAPRASTGE
jgi:hypothetical protein